MLIAVLTILSLVAPASAESKIDILTILDQFMISKAVASKCTPPDKEKRAKFLLNMETVRLHATQRLKKMYPKATDEMIAKGAMQRQAELNKGVSEIVAKEGCDGPQIKEALKRFDIQADMNLFALTKDK
ncbi:hypothetical protein NBH19_22005 [Rhizobium sp. S95]|uniref:DUF5333 domain-containing protein n=1 Tax=Ciceribacter sichuanensis TaxID=2949647 RepID=A0AAJ1F6S9_9HYPH|nr:MULTISPECIES: hypothetical protein [unclassified Ciceribacter]MCM2398757.1 hypothetical protein [Ciceribacter sp. S95]MCO5957037.1 hypothetical protein [Ciceribacter sp. S101]